MGKSSQKAQSTMDYLILTTVVLVVIVPLLFISTDKIGTANEAQIAEAVQALKSGIISVNNLGYGTTKRVVVQIPPGVTKQSVSGNRFYYVINGQTYSATLPVNKIKGNLPINPGRHYVSLYNDNDEIFLYQCGNDIREGPEQCDGIQQDACATTAKPSGPGLGCLGPNEKGACRCRCTNNNQCPTKNCIKTGPSTGFCGPCTKDRDCGIGKICQAGNCKDPTCPACPAECPKGQSCSTTTCGKCVDDPVCKTNKECDYPRKICSTLGKCEPCTGDSQCDMGHKCDKRTNICVKPCTNPDSCDYPKTTCFVDPPNTFLTCQPCTLEKQCKPGDTCTAGKCKPKPCKDNNDCLGVGYCDGDTCKACKTMQDCKGNICTNGRCDKCDSKTNKCPTSLNYVCATNNKCKWNGPPPTPPPGGPICGNGWREPLEGCEDASHCTAKKCYKAVCTVCTCTYVLSDECAKASDCAAKEGQTASCDACKCTYKPTTCKVPPDECAEATDCEPRQGYTASCNKCVCQYTKKVSEA